LWGGVRRDRLCIPPNIRAFPSGYKHSPRLSARQLERALVIVPTYNESENLPRLIPSILSRDPRLEILVVDDASPDGTGKMAEEIAAAEPRVHVLHRAGKLGLGTAYLDGFRWGLQRGYDVLFEMDADFSHDPVHLPQFLEAIENYDVVLGSRYLHGRVTVVNWPIGRLLLSYFANIYAGWVTGLPIADATGGFKCFRREVLAAIDLDRVESNGYAFQIEMSFRAWKKGFRLGEIPIMFVDRDQGESKMSKKIVREAVWRVWRLRFLSMTGRLERKEAPRVSAG
jgi:dolichol-phosphate mannosyltransferase